VNTRARQGPAVFVTAVLLAAVVLTAVSSCTTAPPSPPEGVQMSTSASASTAGARVDWDLSTPRTPTELGGRSADVVAVETLGVNGVQVQLTLPGPDRVTGSFGLVTGDSGGGGGPVRYLSLATTQLHDGAWEPFVERFLAEFGGDRSAVTAGRADPGRTFPGPARPGYRPALQVRPALDGVVVAWTFTLTG
jgi:hypothetical protein